MSPSPTVLGDEYDGKYVAFEYLLHAALVADRYLGAIRLRQLVTPTLTPLGLAYILIIA